MDKLKQLRKLMEDNNIDVYYVPSDDDHMSEYVADHFMSRKFITGFTGSAGVAIVTKDKAGLWTDGRYFVQARNQLKDTGFKLYKQRVENEQTEKEFILENISENGTLAFDGSVVSQSVKESFEELIKSKNGNIVLDKDLIGDIWEDRVELPNTKTFFLADEYSGESVKDKILKIREDLKKDNSDVLVFSSLEDVAWLFNLRGFDIKDTPINYAYGLVKDDVTLYINIDKLDDISKAEFEKNSIIIKDYNEIENDLSLLNDKTISLDKSNLNSYLFSKINDSNTIINKSNPAVLYRAVKNEVQMENLRKSHLRDGVAITKFIHYVKSNIGKTEMSELSVTKKLYELRSSQDKFVTESFSTIAAYGANAAMMHYSANEETNTVLKPENFLLVDSGGTYLDGTTDITRTIALGEVKEEYKKYYTLVLAGVLRLMNSKFLYGSNGSNLDILVRDKLWRNNIDYRSGTGHGVGFVMSVHEGPQYVAWGRSRNNVVFEEGMVVTDEPGVYIDDVVGIRIENELLVRKDVHNEYGQFLRFETITYCPIDLDAIDIKYLDKDEIDTLNTYHKDVYEKLSPFMDEKELVWLKEATRSIG